MALRLYGLVWSPADVEMGDSVRLLYVHVPIAVACYVGCFITTVASAMWLRKRTPGWDAAGRRRRRARRWCSWCSPW